MGWREAGGATFVDEAEREKDSEKGHGRETDKYGQAPGQQEDLRGGCMGCPGRLDPLPKAPDPQGRQGGDRAAGPAGREPLCWDIRNLSRSQSRRAGQVCQPERAGAVRLSPGRQGTPAATVLRLLGT